VVEPWFSSVLGGGTWGLYFDAQTGEVSSLDGVGPVGSKATLADYRARTDDAGMHQANVPGSWDAWMLWLDRFGLLDLGQVLEPAIRIARAGYPVSSEMAFWLERETEAILSHPDTARIYAPDGEVPVSGDIITQDDMASTFEALVQAYDTAAGGTRSEAIQAARDYYYRGPLAEAIVQVSDRDNGYFTLDDFANFEAAIVGAISIDYGDTMAVYQNPPNSQGITMLLALNILKRMDHTGLEPHHPDVVHSQVEALKLAFGDRHNFIGDPAFVEIPIEELLSDEHAADQLARIDMTRAMAWPQDAPLTQMEPAHTTTFQVVDRFGNGVSVTTSLGAQFYVVGGTGIHINERNRFLSIEEGNPNQFAPGHKVRHTSCPYMVLRNGRLYVLGGNTGVDTQPQAQLQQLMSAIDFDLDAQGAINLPRFVSTAFPATNYPWEVGNTLQLEEGFPDETIAELEARGHEIVVGEGIFGSAGMIIVDEDGTDAEFGAEPRISTSFGKVIPTSEQ
jgi:gamma-glutamyltranspeptidase/glutathione hydrolase